VEIGTSCIRRVNCVFLRSTPMVTWTGTINLYFAFERLDTGYSTVLKAAELASGAGYSANRAVGSVLFGSAEFHEKRKLKIFCQLLVHPSYMSKKTKLKLLQRKNLGGAKGKARGGTRNNGVTVGSRKYISI